MSWINEYAILFVCIAIIGLIWVRKKTVLKVLTYLSVYWFNLQAIRLITRAVNAFLQKFGILKAVVFQFFFKSLLDVPTFFF